MLEVQGTRVQRSGYRECRGLGVQRVQGTEVQGS